MTNPDLAAVHPSDHARVLAAHANLPGQALATTVDNLLFHGAVAPADGTSPQRSSLVEAPDALVLRASSAARHREGVDSCDYDPGEDRWPCHLDPGHAGPHECRGFVR